MTFGLKAFNLLDAARACPNYVSALGIQGMAVSWTETIVSSLGVSPAVPSNA